MNIGEVDDAVQRLMHGGALSIFYGNVSLKRDTYQEIEDCTEAITRETQDEIKRSLSETLDSQP